MTLERIKNDRGYEPGNCRWATAPEQQRNTRHNVWVTIDDSTLCLKDWATKIGINYVTVCMRIKRGMSVMDALMTPVLNR